MLAGFCKYFADFFSQSLSLVYMWSGVKIFVIFKSTRHSLGLLRPGVELTQSTGVKIIDRVQFL